MDQLSFIRLTSQYPVKVIQGPDGITTVTIRDNVIITHESEKRNRMILKISEGNVTKRYSIPSRVELQEIYLIHQSHEKGFISALLMYAIKNLKEI